MEMNSDQSELVIFYTLKPIPFHLRGLRTHNMHRIKKKKKKKYSPLPSPHTYIEYNYILQMQNSHPSAESICGGCDRYIGMWNRFAGFTYVGGLWSATPASGRCEASAGQTSLCTYMHRVHMPHLFPG